MGLFLEDLIEWLLNVLIWAIVLNAILSWLVAFDVINLRHPIAARLARLLDAISRPILRPFQRIVPPLGGIDVTPIIAIVILSLVRIDLVPWLFKPVIAVLGG